MFSRTGGSNYHTFGDYLIQLSLSAKQFFFCDDKIDVKSIGYGGTYEWNTVTDFAILCTFWYVGSQTKLDHDAVLQARLWLSKVSVDTSIGWA